MTAIPYYTPVPAFYNDDVLSSTKLNQILTNLDAIYGLDQRMSIGSTYGLTTSQATGNNDWVGWVAFHGDRLVINLQAPGRVHFDGPTLTKQEYFYRDYSTAGVKIIQIPDNGYHDYEVYRISQSFSDTILPPFYAYMTNSNAAAIGTPPAFTNGVVSDADDFNDILIASDTLAEQFNQPVVSGSYWTNDQSIGWLNDQDYHSIKFWAQHRHPQFEFYLTATSSSAASGTQNDVLVWLANNQQFWSRTLAWGENWNPGTPQVVEHPVLEALTVGNWYQFEYRHNMYEGSHDNGVSKLYWYGERQATGASGFAYYTWRRLKRWEVGGVVNGDAGTTPVLDTMNINLAYLDGRRYSTNQVMRQSRQIRDDPLNDSRTERTFSRRVHRWLAYENATEDDTPTLFYTTTRPNVLASVTLTPSLTTVYIDLDTTPVKNGMVFYVDNCNYAIQVPEPGIVII